MKPKIICHMMSSIDGRLIVDRWSPPAQGVDRHEILKHYDAVAARFEANGWMVGRKTMEQVVEKTSGNPRITVTETIPRSPYMANRKGRDVAVALDPRGKLHYGQDHSLGDHIISILGERVSDDYLAELREDGISYLFAGQDGRNLPQALEILADTFGIKTLLLEGGGEINGAFLKAGLIDEISLLVYPSIDGLAGVPGIFEYIGAPDEFPALGQSLRHLSTETLHGGVVWIHYKLEAKVR